jgi:hypothetical protein
MGGRLYSRSVLSILGSWQAAETEIATMSVQSTPSCSSGDASLAAFRIKVPGSLTIYLPHLPHLHIQIGIQKPMNETI